MRQIALRSAMEASMVDVSDNGALGSDGPAMPAVQHRDGIEI